jgi:hypothetical protein
MLNGCGQMDDKVRALIGMGAAFVVGALSTFEENAKTAKEHGATVEELEEVLSIARSAKLAGSMEMDVLVESTIKRAPKTELKILSTSNSACGCGPEGCC